MICTVCVRSAMGRQCFKLSVHGEGVPPVQVLAGGIAGCQVGSQVKKIGK